MRKLIAVAAIAALAVVGACADADADDAGPDSHRDFQVANFQKIEVSGPFEVQVRTGSAASVSANGPQNALDRMVVEVRGDTLSIHPKNEKGAFRWSWGGHNTINVTVTVPMLTGARIAGSGGVRVDHVKAAAFDGNIEGSGDLSLNDVDVGSLNLSVGGSGSMKVDGGKAGRIGLNIAGSGDIDTKGVAAEHATASIAGSGNITARATGTAAINITGSGDVELTGGAKCSISQAGSGNVRCS